MKYMKYRRHYKNVLKELECIRCLGIGEARMGSQHFKCSICNGTGFSYDQAFIEDVLERYIDEALTL